jgi:class 3 adenylate cyclase
LVAPGEVLASSTVRDLVAGSGIIFTDRGRAWIEGISDRWHLYAVDPEERGGHGHLP